MHQPFWTFLKSTLWSLRSFWSTDPLSEKRTAAELKPLQVSWHRWLGLKAGHGMTWHDMAPHNSRAAVWSQTFPLSLWSLWIQWESLIMFDHARRCQAKLRSWRNLLSWKGYSNIVSIKLVLHVVAVAPCWSMLHLSDIIYRILILSFAFFCLSKKSHRRSQVSDHLPAEDLSRAE
jgi:hypothetical protein